MNQNRKRVVIVKLSSAQLELTRIEMMTSNKSIITILGVLFISVQAFAQPNDVVGWSEVTWGMKQEEVRRIFKGAVFTTKDDYKCAESIYSKLEIPDLLIGKRPYTVKFCFETKTNKLVLILVEKTFAVELDFNNLEQIITNEFGKPKDIENKRGKFLVNVRNWELPKTFIKLWYYRGSSDAKVGLLSLKYWDRTIWDKLSEPSVKKTDDKVEDEKEAWRTCLKEYRRSGIGMIKVKKESGRLNYPIKERDTAMNCLNGRYITMPAGLNQMLFSGCEDVSLTNWKGEYDSVKYDETWVYSDNNANVEVYWNEGKFVLQIGYYLDDGFINFIRDRVYYESHPQSKNC